MKSPVEVSAEILASLRQRAEDTFNDDLFGAVGGTGFPTFMYFDDAGGVLASRAGGMDVGTMSGSLHDKAKARREGYLSLQKKAEVLCRKYSALYY